MLFLAKSKGRCAFTTSDFPSENPRTQTRNFPYTKPLATTKQTGMQKIIFIGILILLVQFGYSQEKIESNTSEKNMKKTSILGLRTTIYKVGDIEKARDWYAKAFETKAYFDEPYYVGFNIGGYELGLQPEEGTKGEKIESVVSYWGVDKIQEVYNRLISLGATENEKPYNVGGEIMTATLKDPFGNVIGLIYNPYFKLKN